MKNLSVILACILVAFISCTKSKEVHPELGDGNDEIVTVGMKDVHVEYTRSDITELSKVMFHYGPADANGHAQQFATAEMTKNTTFFELTLNDLLSDTLYWYYYELIPKDGDIFITEQKTFHTQVLPIDIPEVVTMEVNSITHNSVHCFGNVINDGGDEVTERGVCWGLSENPLLDGNYVAAGNGLGEYSTTINGLEPNTTYQVRAYAKNRKGTGFGTIISFTTSSEIPSDGLVAYYPFNGNAIDETGNGHDGAIIGDVTLCEDRKGNMNAAFRFSGEPFNYISVEDAEDLHLNTFTLNAWVYTDANDYGFNAHLICKGRDIIDGSYALQPHGVRAENSYGGSNGAGIEGIPEVRVWHMLTSTIQGDQAKFYIDGVLMDENTLSNPFEYNNSEPLTLGMHYYTGLPDYYTYPLLGVLDDVRIYNRVLTFEEIQALFVE